MNTTPATTQERIFNFSAGPAVLPLEVLQQAQQEMLNWQGTGMSVMEISHRSDAFLAIVKQTSDDCRELLGVPSNYQILFLPGGGTLQFSMVPMNLLAKNPQADYVQTGFWSQKAIAEAQRYGDIHIASTTKKVLDLATIPDQSSWQLRSNAAYVHYVHNETIDGITFPWVPDCGKVPLVADMSSCIFSAPIDVSQFGLIYAGAQKNMGPAGITLVIIRDDLVTTPMPMTPTMLTYQDHVKAQSLLNTPPTYSWYMVGLVLQWLKRKGGLVDIQRDNVAKAKKLYDYIDSEAFYRNPVAPAYRSLMNVPFTLAHTSLDECFLSEASMRGLENLAGHRSIGGMRASIYNAMPLAGVETLIEFMADFVKRKG